VCNIIISFHKAVENKTVWVTWWLRLDKLVNLSTILGYLLIPL